MTKYGYTRVSSKSQENNFSLEAQKQQLGGILPLLFIFLQV